MSAFLEVNGLSKQFGTLEVLRGVSFDVERGAVVAIVGPSGSGKSTTLRCINHLEQPDRGSIVVDGQRIGYERHRGRLVEMSPASIARQRRAIGMVFQRFNLYPHMSAAENVALAPRRLLKLSNRAARELAQEQLAAVGLSDKADAYPRQLSGGQQQRVAIARALAMRPKLMLFDEPTSALDPELVDEVLSSIERLAAEGMTMLVVTHELHFARDVATDMLFMADGRVVERGNPRTLIENPQTDRLRAFASRVIRA
jgi:polar amino acid transport system ATP-binding protein